MCGRVVTELCCITRTRECVRFCLGDGWMDDGWERDTVVLAIITGMDKYVKQELGRGQQGGSVAYRGVETRGSQSGWIILFFYYFFRRVTPNQILVVWGVSLVKNRKKTLFFGFWNGDTVYQGNSLSLQERRAGWINLLKVTPSWEELAMLFSELSIVSTTSSGCSLKSVSYHFN